VPTSHHVKLLYGTTAVEWLGRAATVAGFVGLGLLVWWGWNRGVPITVPSGAAAPVDDGENTGGRRRRRPVRFPLRSRDDPGG
jgi:hypothetical protein